MNAISKPLSVSRLPGPPPAWTPLPERVVVEFETPKPQAFKLDPANTALVIIDMQNAYVHSDKFPFTYFTPKSPNPPRRTPATLGRMASSLHGCVKLLEKARSAGIPVIYIQSVRPKNNLEVTRFGVSPHLLEGTPDVQIVPELAPRPGETVVKKQNHDPWADTELEAVLAEKNIVAKTWTVIVAGVSAAGCHHAGALGFSNRHYMTLIPLDCTAAGTVEDEARTYALYLADAYNYNVAFTLSEQITFQADAPPAEKQLVLASA